MAHHIGVYAELGGVELPFTRTRVRGADLMVAVVGKELDSVHDRFKGYPLQEGTQVA